MSDGLLPYYDAELAALRRLAGGFAEAHPRAAGRLRLAADGQADDPHVERLLQGVAFLAARVQQRLDDGFPEITDALLELLCPHLLAPLPSMATLRLAPKREARGPARVARHTPFEAATPRGEAVRYATCHAVELWPLRVEEARLAGLPLAAPDHPLARGAQACLRIGLGTTAEGLGFAAMAAGGAEAGFADGLARLRLHFRGAPRLAAGLHELVCASTLAVAVADGPDDPAPLLLGPEAVEPAGHAREEAALLWPARAFDGHRVLAEHFAHPERFLYADFAGLGPRAARQPGRRLDLFLYLGRAAPELERLVSAEAVALNCTPAVNLFAHTCEPIRLDGARSDWLVVPDARRPSALEIVAVESVREARPNLDPRPVQPFFRLPREGEGGAGDAAGGEAAPAQWLARRGPAPPELGGTETRLLLRDPAFRPEAPAEGALRVRALCCNRDLPRQLPFGAGQPRMRLADPEAPAAPEAECLSPPTHTLRPELGSKGAWRLVSHLALNHLAVTGGRDAALALQEFLRLNDHRGTPESRAAIAALAAVEARPGLARIPGQRPGVFARGLDVTLVFDPEAWAAGGLYGLAAAVERFLRLQVSVNGFVRTRVRLAGRDAPVAAFPPRSGTRALL